MEQYSGSAVATPTRRRSEARPDTAEQIAAELRQEIVRGRIPEHDLPRQEDLARQFGVSAPTMRDALRILDAEGLVKVRRGRIGGAEVRRPGASTVAFPIGLALEAAKVTLADLGQAIAQLEPLCAASCAERPDRLETVVPFLRRNIEECRGVVDDFPEYVRRTNVFHGALIEFSANATLRLVAGSVMSTWSVEKAIGWTDPDDLPTAAIAADALAAHATLTDLIEAGDAVAVQSFAALHQHATQHHFIDRYGSRVIDASSEPAWQEYRRI